MTASSPLNPFLVPGAPPPVRVAAGAGAYDNTRAALSTIDLSAARGKRVLLKPNAGRVAGPGSGITTDPQVVAAAIDAFQAAGAEVAVGESPITGVRALEALEATGIAAVAVKRNCPVIDLDERPAVEVTAPDGVAMKKFKVCADVIEHDLVVSIPVMKVHMHTGVTLAVKNMKGCLWRRSKVDLHMLPPTPGSEDKSLNVAIADMASVLRPHMAVIDGTVGMEGLGPSAGTPKPLGAVIVGPDAFAADAVACRLMGKDPLAVPHLAIGAKRGYGIIDLDRIDISPASWPDLASHFEPPPENLSIEFPNVEILDRNSCSACQSTVLLFLQKHGEEIFDYFPSGEKIRIAIGKGHEQLPPKTLCIGNCTERHWSGRTSVAGCPPVGSAILRAITEANRKKT